MPNTNRVFLNDIDKIAAKLFTTKHNKAQTVCVLRDMNHTCYWQLDIFKRPFWFSFRHFHDSFCKCLACVSSSIENIFEFRVLNLKMEIAKVYQSLRCTYFIDLRLQTKQIKAFLRVESTEREEQLMLHTLQCIVLIRNFPRDISSTWSLQVLDK